MIKAIGYNKVFLIGLLSACLVAVFLYNQRFLKPDLDKKNRILRTNSSEISEMTDNLNKLSEGLQKFEKQKADFERVQNLGFFDSQNRVEARQIITEIQQESRLLSAKYQISPAQSVGNKMAQEAGSKILTTAIKFDLEAIEDSDIYKFIYILNYAFPGQLAINDFSMSREVEVTQPILRKIGVGQAEALVKASMSVTWKTMVPDESLSVTGDSSNQGGVR